MSIFADLFSSYADWWSIILPALKVAVFGLPFIIAYAIFQLWLDYIQIKFIHNLEWVTLEIKVPRVISKSPQAMEIVLGCMHQPSDGNLIDQYIVGKVRTWFSLELVSIGGAVHFYIRAQKGQKNLLEAHLYSQYPEIEVVEVEDYTRQVPYGVAGSNWKLWGTEFAFVKNDAYPIKTYVDYGLDRDPKEEYKIDPLATTLEILGSVPAGQQMWLQIMIVASRKRLTEPGKWFTKQDWASASAEEIKKLAKRDIEVTALNPKVQLSPGEKTVLEAVERGLGKYTFDCGIRGIYLAKEEVFDNNYIGALVNTVKQYGSLNLNGFKLYKRTAVEYPWQDLTGRLVPWLKRELFNNYVQRAYFYPPVNHQPLGMNTEEVATMFHFPGQSTATPTLERIESRRGEPPVNLPV